MAKWRRVRAVLESLVKKRRQKYGGSQKDALLASNGDRAFFKNVKNSRSHEKQKPFDVRSLFPGRSEVEVAELLAQHSNAINSEFEPLEPHQIPVTKNRTLPVLQQFKVAACIRVFKKPNSMVKGDIFPQLY